MIFRTLGRFSVWINITKSDNKHIRYTMSSLERFTILCCVKLYSVCRRRSLMHNSKITVYTRNKIYGRRYVPLPRWRHRSHDHWTRDNFAIGGPLKLFHYLARLLRYYVSKFTQACCHWKCIGFQFCAMAQIVFITFFNIGPITAAERHHLIKRRNAGSQARNQSPDDGGSFFLNCGPLPVHSLPSLPSLSPSPSRGPQPLNCG